jgi:hypothetical protein
MPKFVAVVFISTALAVSSALPIAPAAAASLSTILFGAPNEPFITVVFLKPHYHDDEPVPAIYRFPSPAMQARAQDEIASNPVIRASLQRRKILPENVMAVQTAANGGKIIYVR